MEIEFKLNGNTWEAEFQSVGASSVMVARQWADIFTTHYGKDESSMIKYVKGCFVRDDRQNIGFDLDIPEGCLVKMTSGAPITSCSVIEKVMKTSSGGGDTPSERVQADWNETNPDSDAFIKNKPGIATNNTAGLIDGADMFKLNLLASRGYSNSRPSWGDAQIGYSYFDMTLNKPLWWTKNGWVDANGSTSVDSVVKALPKVTSESDGLMLFSDKVKLDGIEPEANKYMLAKASDTSLGGIMLGHVNKVLYEYPVELDSEGRAFVSVPQRELSGMKMIEFESYANDYTGIWSTSASDVTHMDFVMGDNIDAGNINDTFRWRFTSNNLLGSKVAKPQESDLHTIMELLPHGAKAGELKIADAAGALQHVLTKADFASIPAEVTSANIVDVLKQIVGILKP